MSLATHPLLDEILGLLNEMDPDKLDALKTKVYESTKSTVWVPNPGPQTAALSCSADELFYGGSAGGGKTDLVVGLSLTEHQRSLILRRFNDDARDMAERLLDVLGSRDGYNSQLMRYQGGKLLIDFGGCKDENDKQRFKGRPHDLIAFDEIGDFLESQYRFIIGWNRSADPEQRCRILSTGNPPTTADGFWVIRYWGPWLDPTHPNPAQEGELRWFTTEGGRDIEVDGRGPHTINGEKVYARSRSFIRARLDDNPDLTQTDDYRATLAALPEHLRDAYRDGRFDRSIKENPQQAIPTAWILAAQQRWVERPPQDVPMSAIGVDVAQGGQDNNVLAPRYDGWFAYPEVIPGAQTPLGTDVAGVILSRRRNDAVIVIDCGGGYGGSTYKTLQDNGITARAYKGAERSGARSVEGKLKFTNKRTEIYWRFREALDPSQPWGSPISLPPDPEIVSDLAAPTFETTPQGIKLESAEKVKQRLGRSPDKGSAILMSWCEGQKGITYHFLSGGANAEMGLKQRTSGPVVQLDSRRQRKSRQRRRA